MSERVFWGLGGLHCSIWWGGWRDFAGWGKSFDRLDRFDGVDFGGYFFFQLNLALRYLPTVIVFVSRGAIDPLDDVLIMYVNRIDRFIRRRRDHS